jgi:hypothetical protein
LWLPRSSKCSPSGAPAWTPLVIRRTANSADQVCDHLGNHRWCTAGSARASFVN